jgi:hypothetical protein
MAVMLATVLAAGIAILPNSVQDAHAGQCNDNTIGYHQTLEKVDKEMENKTIQEWQK